jgi:hypothetical protein
LLAMASASLSWAQPVGSEDSAEPQQAPLGQRSERPNPEEQQRDQMLKDMAKQANLKRQQDLKRDTDKLLELATQLKAYVDKTNENVMSLEVLKKSEEIERLAHSVKEKMKAN